MDGKRFHPAYAKSYLDYFSKTGGLRVNHGLLSKLILLLLASMLIFLSLNTVFACDTCDEVPSECAYDVAICKSVIPVDYQEEVTFTIGVHNLGCEEVTGVKVEDLYPEGIQATWADPQQGTYNFATGIWDIGTLQSGQKTWMHLSGIVTRTGTFTNTATLYSMDQEDCNPSNNQATASFTVKPRADIAVDKEFWDGSEENLCAHLPVTSANYGTNVWAVVKVTNNGPDMANVVIKDTLPEGLVYISHAIFNGTDHLLNNPMAFDPNAAQWTINNIKVGASQYLALLCLVNKTGTLTNKAEIVYSNLCDPNTSNNQACAKLTVPPAADLVLTKTVDKATVYVGDIVKFTFIIQNRGPDTAVDVKMTDVMPEGLSFISYTANYGTYDPTTGIWTIDTLPMNTIAQLTVVSQALTSGTKINYANVVSLVYDPILDNNGASAGFTTLDRTSDGEEPGDNEVGAQEVGMQETGTPIAALLIAIFLVIAGTIYPKK